MALIQPRGGLVSCFKKRPNFLKALINLMRTRQDLLRFDARVLWRDSTEYTDGEAPRVIPQYLSFLSRRLATTARPAKDARVARVTVHRNTGWKLGVEFLLAA